MSFGDGEAVMSKKTQQKEKRQQASLTGDIPQERRPIEAGLYKRELARLQVGLCKIKYWFSVSDDEQERRFRARIEDPTKRWKLSKMDLEARVRWVDYSKAKDDMFASTDIKQAPWYVVPADDKKRARLNCISHLLSMIPYGELPAESFELPTRQEDTGYVWPPLTDQTFVSEVY